jgi:GNAT superfamily N-acetyltransferase
MIEIRRVSDESDFERLYDLFVEYEADLPPELRHGVVPAMPGLRATYTGKSAAFMALSEGEAMGCVAVRELGPDTALLLRLFVRPARRGLGAARLLTKAAIAHARESGCRRIVLDTNREQLEPAYRLYQSLGFVECEPFAEVAYEFPTFMELLL